MALLHSFAKKRILVTGGGRGLGYDMVKRFYKDGATVFVLDRDEVLLDNVKQEMPGLTTLLVDLADWDATMNAVLGLAPLDHLVNNAGVLRSAFLLDVKPEDFDLMFSINVRAVLCCSQAFVKGIDEKGAAGGTIVNISSMSDRVGFWGGGIYGTTKCAITRLTMAMALEFAAHEIRVNCVCPSFIHTEMVKTIPQEFLILAGPLTERTPMKQQMEPKDVSDAVLFLSSPLSGMVTGTSLAIDGGLRTG